MHAFQRDTFHIQKEKKKKKKRKRKKEKGQRQRKFCKQNYQKKLNIVTFIAVQSKIRCSTNHNASDREVQDEGWRRGIYEKMYTTNNKVKEKCF
jgi:hypothetical protein